jgi:hypothetical protein
LEKGTSDVKAQRLSMATSFSPPRTTCSLPFFISFSDRFPSVSLCSVTCLYRGDACLPAVARLPLHLPGAGQRAVLDGRDGNDNDGGRMTLGSRKAVSVGVMFVLP